MAFLTVEYDDGHMSTYRGLKLFYTEKGKEQTIVFNTGDAVVDFFEYNRWLFYRTLKFWEAQDGFNHSSSYDHFFMDGGRKPKWRIQKYSYKLKRFVTPEEVMSTPRSQKKNWCDVVVATDSKMETFEQVEEYYNHFRGINRMERSDPRIDYLFTKKISCDRTGLSVKLSITSEN